MSDPKENQAPAAAPREGERIAKRLARAGLCSRRDAERWIAQGRVAVDGRVLTSPAVNVTQASRITVDGDPIPEKTPTRLWRYHKPRGLLTTHRDPEGRPTIFDELPQELPRVITIGRLDLNSEGLLLLTNDGALARKLELPATGWIRRYRVRVHGTVDPQALAGLAQGVTVEGVRYGAVKAQLDRQQGENAWLTMALAEGKNREVRRICEHLGWQVNRLIRVAYGPFQLGLLEPGGVEEVSARVVKEQMGDSGARPATAAEKRRQREAAHDEKRRQKREEARAAEQRTLRPGKRERAARWGKSGEAAGRPESKPQGGRPAAARGDLPSPGKAGFGKAGLPSPGKAGFGKAGLPSPGKAGFGKAGRPFGKPGRAIAKPGQAGGAGFEPRDRAQRGKRGERRLERIEESFETREARSFTPREGHGKASRPSPRAGGAQGAPDQPRLNKDRRRKPGGGPTKPGHAHRRRPS
jgi:23S rRNA pseudouridine2605 synthase